MAIVCDGYLEIQLSKENFVSIQQVIRRLVDGLPEEEFTPRLIDTCWAKGAAIMVCHMRPGIGWVVKYQP